MSTAMEIRDKHSAAPKKMHKAATLAAVDTTLDIENGVNTYTFNDGSTLAIELDTGRTEITDARY